MAHYPCVDCCGEVVCIIFSDDFNRSDNDDLGAGWNEFVGNGLISGNVLSIDGSASDARILATAAIGGLGSGLGVSVRLRADSGERIGVVLWDDASSYMEATVRFSSSATGGRLNFNYVNASVIELSHSEEFECGANEHDIPDEGWATLTLEIHNCGGFGRYAGKVTLETATETYSIGFQFTPAITIGFAGVMTEDTPTLAEFDDFSVYRMGSGCPSPMTCCNWGYEAIDADFEHGGWDYNPAEWETEPIACIPDFYVPADPTYFEYVERTFDDNVKQIAENQWVNSNVDLRVTVASACEGPGAGDIVGNKYRLILEDNSPNSWWVECEAFPEIEYAGITFNWIARLQYGGVTQAYILFAKLPEYPGEEEPIIPTISIRAYDCKIEFGMYGLGNSLVLYSTDDGEPEAWTMLVTGFTICVEGNDIAGLGKIGFGTGDSVSADGAGFASFIATCSEDFTCENTGEPYDPEDPEPDPFGCCPDFAGLLPGQSIEVDVAGVNWEAGAWCIDGSGICIFDYDFMADINATWVMTLTSRTATEMHFFGFIAGSINPCDGCAGVDLGDITIPFQLAAELTITDNEDGTCTARMYIYVGSCDVCTLILSATFSDADTCDAGVTLSYESGDGLPGLQTCCIQGNAGTASLYLP